jgi:hypothetical protein
MLLRVLPKAAFAALCIHLLTGAHTGALAAEISTVKASGQAALSGHSMQKVRRIALEDALYLAAISAGTEISGTTISTNGILVRDVVSLNTNAQLVDFTVLKEGKTETHYQVSVEAFFVQKSRSQCQNPRFPSILLLKPQSYVSSNVDVRYHELAGSISNQLQETLTQFYSGVVHDYSNLSLEDYKKSASKNRLFSYSSLQSNQPVSNNADFIIVSDVRVHRSGKTLNADVKLNVLLGSDHSVYREYERRLTAKLPEKSPFKTINVLMPKDINLNTEPLIEPIELLNQNLVQMACEPLKGRLKAQGGQLIFPFGSDAGLKKGGLAYVTNGSESWSLLEVTKVFPTSSAMVPINNLQNKSRLANQTVRIIEGTIR